MTVNLTACDKGSSSGFVRTFNFDTKEQFVEQFNEFSEEVPFSRWYPDVTSDDDDDTEKLVNSWLEEILP